MNVLACCAWVGLMGRPAGAWHAFTPLIVARPVQILAEAEKRLKMSERKDYYKVCSPFAAAGPSHAARM